jgi:hypothetical protein
MTELRDCISKNEIISFFKTMKRKNEKLLIWQSHFSPRLKCEVKIDHIIVQTGTIIFKPAYPSDDMFDFVSTNTLFVRSEFKELLFKIQRKTWDEGVDKITIKIPKEVKVVELRKYKRQPINPNQFFTMKISQKILRGTQLIHNNFKMQMLDISSGGACVLVSNSNTSFFKEGNLLHVTDMGDLNIFDQLESEVAYIADSDVLGCRKMGLHFKRKIDKSEMSELNLPT